MNFFLNFAKSCVLSCLSNVGHIKKIHSADFELQVPRAVVKGFFASHAIAMETYCVAKMITTRSSIVGQFFDTMIVTSSDKEWL